MSHTQGMTHGIAMAISDLLDNVAKVQPGNEVLILAHVDGLHGGSDIHWSMTEDALRS